MTRKSILHVKQILDWADAHFERTGQWPDKTSGRIPEEVDERWERIDVNLYQGNRGLRGGSSLARLLAQHRGRRNRKALPRYTLDRILRWADAHYARTGSWPKGSSGPIADAPGETWTAVEIALSHGRRGLPGGSSLARLLAERRDLTHPLDRPKLSIKQILIWADAHYERTGLWPGDDSGIVVDAPGETWMGIRQALSIGRRGLRGGSSLYRLLRAHRKSFSRRRLPRLNHQTILKWADAHRRRTGRWPKVHSGSVHGAAGETWGKVNEALRTGKRSLPAGSSLARLLAEHRNVRYHLDLPPFTIDRILAWADAHHAKYGKWPKRESGAVKSAPGETWAAVGVALSHGTRGLRGGSSLAQLLEEHRGVPNRARRPKLTIGQILAWIDLHHERTGLWPQAESGQVADAPNESWRGIDDALRAGLRGLPSGSSLARLLVRHRGIGTHRRQPPLAIETILQWADAHRARTGRWPSLLSGEIKGANGETWQRVENALRDGRRGLPGGSTLAGLLFERRGVRNAHHLPPLTERQILAWAERHYKQQGKWPTVQAGAIAGVAGENWHNIDYALRAGARGLRGGSSLSRLIARHRRRKG